MVIIQEKGSTQQPSRKILPRESAYDTVQNTTVLPLQDMNREFMMIMNQNKVKMANEDTTTGRNPDSTSGIYLTTVKVAQ